MQQTVITPDQERYFYDHEYRKFLSVPNDALRIDRGVLEKNLSNPSHPFYERSKLYRGAMRALEFEPLKGRKILDYGCGPADFGVWMATEGADVTILDISPVAIQLGLKRAESSGVRVRGVAANAVSLPMFSNGEFDTVFACAALHHTLKYPGAVEELARVMKPNALLVLCETWGANPLLGLARRFRATAAQEPKEQGEAIILSPSELRLLYSHFDSIHPEFMNLFAMAKRYFRGAFGNCFVRSFVHLLEQLDSDVLATFPAFRAWCGEVVITARRR